MHHRSKTSATLSTTEINRTTPLGIMLKHYSTGIYNNSWTGRILSVLIIWFQIQRISVTIYMLLNISYSVPMLLLHSHSGHGEFKILFYSGCPEADRLWHIIRNSECSTLQNKHYHRDCISASYNTRLDRVYLVNRKGWTRESGNTLAAIGN